MRNLSRIAVSLNDLISDAELLTKLSGEQYSMFDTIHKTVVLGVQDVADMSNWQLQEDGTSITFPHLSQAMIRGIFGNISKVFFQVKKKKTAEASKRTYSL